MDMVGRGQTDGAENRLPGLVAHAEIHPQELCQAQVRAVNAGVGPTPRAGGRSAHYAQGNVGIRLRTQICTCEALAARSSSLSGPNIPKCAPHRRPDPRRRTTVLWPPGYGGVGRLAKAPSSSRPAAPTVPTLGVATTATSRVRRSGGLVLPEPATAGAPAIFFPTPFAGLRGKRRLARSKPTHWPPTAQEKNGRTQRPQRPRGCRCQRVGSQRPAK